MAWQGEDLKTNYTEEELITETADTIQVNPQPFELTNSVINKITNDINIYGSQAATLQKILTDYCRANRFCQFPDEPDPVPGKTLDGAVWFAPKDQQSR